MYSWNSHTLLNRFVFRAWRKPKFMSFLFALVKPLNITWSAFQLYRNAVLLKLNTDFSVVQLEHYLNSEYATAFDLATRDQDIQSESIISVATEDYNPRNYVFYALEQVSTMPLNFQSENVNSNTCYWESEYETETHFTVKVPTAIQYDEKVMQKQIDHYVFAGLNYKIENY